MQVSSIFSSPPVTSPDLSRDKISLPHTQVMRLKAFLAFLPEMSDISTYLSWVLSFGCLVMVDDVGSTLAHKTRNLGSWTIKKVAR